MDIIFVVVGIPLCIWFYTVFIEQHELPEGWGETCQFTNEPKDKCHHCIDMRYEQSKN